MEINSAILDYVVLHKKDWTAKDVEELAEVFSNEAKARRFFGPSPRYRNGYRSDDDNEDGDDGYRSDDDNEDGDDGYGSPDKMEVVSYTEISKGNKAMQAHAVIKVKGINEDMQVSFDSYECGPYPECMDEYTNMILRFPKLDVQMDGATQRMCYPQKRKQTLFKPLYRALDIAKTKDIFRVISGGFANEMNENGPFWFHKFNCGEGMNESEMQLESVAMGALYRLWLWDEGICVGIANQMDLAFKDEVIKTTLKWDKDWTALVSDFVEMDEVFNNL
eukprot:TRINITY_DN1259_c0_g1_i4.p1 TRINITY_DN1259_c0_g1~~TRINITY_DN1259_c0_g1_i4.p1  ORF type:complete len:277 (-),score=64.98 TRINITY_DN1259_c0_g1_i4:118-948(-)